MGRKTLNTAMLGLGLAAMLASAPAQAQAQDAMGEAEQLRRLDIMLMVTALRCRAGPDDFQADYNAFAARNLATLNDAGRRLQAGRGVRHLDRISTTMANHYGQGHPWLDCAGLRAAARDLAATNQRQHLLAAATELLADGPRRSGLVATYTP